MGNSVYDEVLLFLKRACALGDQRPAAYFAESLTVDTRQGAANILVGLIAPDTAVPASIYTTLAIWVCQALTEYEVSILYLYTRTRLLLRDNPQEERIRIIQYAMENFNPLIQSEVSDRSICLEALRDHEQDMLAQRGT